VSTVPGYVLAGGRSRRMGRDKATLRPAPHTPTLAQRVAQVVAEAGAQPVVVVGRQSTLHTLGMPVLPDPQGVDHHPLYGVAAALFDAAARGATHALVVPCDIPDLTVHTLQQLLAAPGAAVAVAGDHIQPLIAKLPTAWAHSARSTADAGGSARRFVDRDAIQRVRISAQDAHDLDTPADLVAWSRRGNRDE